jgi:hypothetical protein
MDGKEAVMDDKPKGRQREFPADLIQFLNVQAYRERLPDADRQIRDDGDDGSKQRRRAQSYDGLTRAYLRVFMANEDRIRAALAEMVAVGPLIPIG